MRILIASIFALCAGLAVAQSTATVEKPVPQTVEQQPHSPPPSRLSQMLAQADGADAKTFTCKCGAVDGKKETSTTCKKGQGCSCVGGAHCTK